MSPAAEDAIAFLFHVPGLVVLAGKRPPEGILGPNLLALGATVTLSGATFVLAPPGVRVPGAVAVFAAGHVLWGVYLVARLRRARAA